MPPGRRLPRTAAPTTAGLAAKLLGAGARKPPAELPAGIPRGGGKHQSAPTDELIGLLISLELYDPGAR